MWDLHHIRSFIYLFIYFFSSGTWWILGYVRPWSVVAVHAAKTGKRRHICGVHYENTLNWDTVRPALWCNCTSNAHSKCADPEVGHSMCVCVCVWRFCQQKSWSGVSEVVMSLSWRRWSCAWFPLMECNYVHLFNYSTYILFQYFTWVFPVSVTLPFHSTTCIWYL